MITFALVALFVISAAAAFLSLSDSAVRGARAYKQLSRAVQIEESEYRAAGATHLAPVEQAYRSTVIQHSRMKPRIDLVTNCLPLPVAA